MRCVAALLCGILLLVPGLAAQEAPSGRSRSWMTPGEQRGWFAPTTPAEMGDYLEGLAAAFGQVTLDTLAWAEGGSVEPDSTLPVLLVKVRRPPNELERVRVLVLAGQRGDELSGTDVTLQMIRELVLGEIGTLLDHLDLVFVPAANPWGLLWWMPDEPSGIDPTRDHAALRSAATAAVHEFAAGWRPQLVVDLREIGPTVYRVQAGLSRHPNVDPGLVSFGRFYLLPYVANELAQASVTFREYVAVSPEAEVMDVPAMGARALPAGASLTPGPLGADRALNAFSLAGELTVMLGVTSLDGAEGLPERVQLMYQTLGFLLEVTANQGEGLRAQASRATGLPEAMDSAGEPFTPALSLRHVFQPDPGQPNLVWLVWNDQGQIVQETTDRWHPLVRRQLALPVPAGWMIDPEGREWAELAASHGFEVERLRRSGSVPVGSYPVGATSDLPPDVAADMPLDSAPDGSSLLVRGVRHFPEGAWLVRADQPRARLLFALLEPWSQDAPLGREGRDETDSPDLTWYPVHRLDPGTDFGALLTEPASLDLPSDGTEPAEAG